MNTVISHGKLHNLYIRVYRRNDNGLLGPCRWRCGGRVNYYTRRCPVRKTDQRSHRYRCRRSVLTDPGTSNYLSRPDYRRLSIHRYQMNTGSLDERKRTLSNGCIYIKVRKVCFTCGV